jgi:hypothetical protein
VWAGTILDAACTVRLRPAHCARSCS